MTRTVTIRALQPEDRADWEFLWSNYQDHLQARISKAATEGTWARLMDNGIALHGLLAVLDDDLIVGFSHYSLSTSSWSKGPLCHLQDLFIAEKYRGLGAGHGLVDGVFLAADKQKASQVFWHLNRSDFRAKLLFDNYNVGPEGQIVQVRRKLSR